MPNGGWNTIKLTAKDDVDNVGAGRAAKGANPSLCATAPISGLFILFVLKNLYYVYFYVIITMSNQIKIRISHIGIL